MIDKTYKIKRINTAGATSLMAFSGRQILVFIIDWDERKKGGGT